MPEIYSNTWILGLKGRLEFFYFEASGIFNFLTQFSSKVLNRVRARIHLIKIKKITSTM